MFQKGKSGNPAGRPLGSVSYKVELKNALEEVFKENPGKIRSKLRSMLKNNKEFRWLCDLKSQYEIKQLPSRIEGELEKQVEVIVKIEKNENQVTPESGNRISQFVEI